jgi:predicted porin
MTDYSRKITYFTPKFGNEGHKVQVGVSYIPDTSNAGHSSINTNSLHKPVPASDFKFAMKDGVSYGITYEGSFNEELSAKLGFVGERGKPVAFDKDTDAKSMLKFKDLNTYVVGGEVTYNQVSVAGSYMNYNKSLTNSTVDTGGRDTSIYTAGAKYNFLTKHAVSLNHFHSDHKKNKVDATTLGADYFITTGIKAYAQVTYYKTKGLNIKNSKADKSKGTIIIVGGKISI